MKRLVYALFAAVVLTAVPAVAGNNALDGPRAFGIGLGGNGWTSGLSGKLFLGSNTALQAIVGDCGWGYYGYDVNGRFVTGAAYRPALCLGADFLFEESGVGRGPLSLNWNYGFGAGASGIGGSGVGVVFNGVLGGSLQILQRVELNIEWRPGLVWASGLRPDLFATGSNLRVYF